jgi:hypothetical protein
MHDFGFVLCFGSGNPNLETPFVTAVHDLWEKY